MKKRGMKERGVSVRKGRGGAEGRGGKGREGGWGGKARGYMARTTDRKTERQMDR